MAEPAAHDSTDTAQPPSPAPGLSPAASPGSEPLSVALSPITDGSQRLLFTHDLVSRKYKESVRFGLVRMIHGEEEFNSDSDLDDGGGRDTGGGGGGGGGGKGGERVPCGSDTESATGNHNRPLCRGFVRVQWYPDGVKQDIRETKLMLEDRSIVIRDIVRRNNSNDSQCGIVTNVDIECTVKIVGTNCVLYPVNSKELQPIWSFMYGDYIAYDFWLGKVYDFTNHIILKLSNGARCSMSVEDGAKLYDVSPHFNDPSLFFDECGFYPGQVLMGPSKVFSNVQWLSGVKPVLCKKLRFRAVVEELKVSELKVTWITKSYSPKGSDSICPPSSTITQENLCRVRRLGYYDHTQTQLGNRGLYVLPENGDATHITFEGPEKPTILQMDPVAKKLKRIFKKDSAKKTENVSTQGEHNLEQTDSHQYNNCPNDQQDIPAEHAEQDADDEAAEDSDDTSSLTSSASSTASSQSGGQGTNRKKSIPLSIRNLKRKHKKKRTMFSRVFKPGDSVAVQVILTKTTVDVMWKDGHLEKGIRSNDLVPIQHLDGHEFYPGDFIVDKRPQALQDPGLYGVIQSGDHRGRTCVVKWIKLNATSDDVEVVGVEEDVSVYDIADHPDYHFRITDIVIRLWNSEVGENDCENETAVGQVFKVDVSSKVEVVWADNSMTIVLPQHLYCVDSEIEETDDDSVEETSSILSTEEWEDDSDSWETVNDAPAEEDFNLNNRDATEIVTPTSCYSTFIIPPQEEDKVGVSSPTKEVVGNESDATVVASSASGGAGAVNGSEKPTKGFRDLKEALKILESLKNMTVEQLWTGLSPTSPTSVAPASAANVVSPAPPTAPEKPNKEKRFLGDLEKRFLDDLKKLQENLRKTLDNVAIVEEEKMEAVVEAGGASKGTKGERPSEEEPRTPVAGQDWPSDFQSETPVLCQQSSGKPGVTFTSAKGEVFSVLDWAPETHSFYKMEFQPAEAKKFFSTVRKEMALLATSLPGGIMVKTFEDRMDLFSALIKGPTRTPYEDGLFLFDIQLPNIYPALPPLFRYLSQCSGRLNPNLYNNGKVCVSLLGTWIGRGNERWTSKSSLLQVLISIQGLILVNEPYYNEAGFDSDRGLQEGYENSRCYNEMALIKMVQSMTQLLQNPVEVFKQEIRDHFVTNGWRLVRRLEAWLELHDSAERSVAAHRAKSSGAEAPDERAAKLKVGDSILEEEPEDSGLGASAKAASQPETGHISDCDGSRGRGDGKGATSVTSETVSPTAAGDGALSQPVVRPKKRRKSYRSFLPEGGGYPDIGFPLFPLSKGFVKSVRCVLLQYRAALEAAGIPERAEDNDP
ncbi:(E3-independent) E2 ubiquitin-conjugating enzyme UBE2O isoform X1 [Corythoichthys intestinalis]|uniref:(E3-independent) E2 ubiquitin-conjugating enzyme UBE2O isoform X1 n=1 Tax=Corythoichthys intestinalis TaxID=161448 RepID=UPI0025A5F1A2|nr:(E3-independent) E2 ubiquitin-conjugating enzyme UBE2O isoform X1 [Corythoichthys intestinalis]